MTVTEIKYMRRTAGYTWTDHETNTELNITPVLDTIQDYQREWIHHINRMPHNRLSQKAEGTKEDQRRDFWMCETGTGQQVAHSLIATS
jgi:hypothetical protein